MIFDRMITCGIYMESDTRFYMAEACHRTKLTFLFLILYIFSPNCIGNLYSKSVQIIQLLVICRILGLHWWLACNEGDRRREFELPGLGRSPGGRNGNPLQYSGLKNPIDRGAWRAIVHRVAQSWTELSNWAGASWGEVRLHKRHLQDHSSTAH